MSTLRLSAVMQRMSNKTLGRVGCMVARK